MQVTELHEDMAVTGKAAVQEGVGLLGGPLLAILGGGGGRGGLSGHL